MWRVLLAILVIALAVVINYFVVVSLQWWGFFQTTYNHAPGPCRKLRGTENGSEDIEMMDNGLAFISSGVDRDTDGQILLFDMRRESSEPEPLEIEAEDDFHLISPHGMSIWKAPDNKIYLYVVSHQPGESVDKFLFDSSSKKLQHQGRFTNESDFIALNDLVVVDDNQFYFTNWYKYCFWMELLCRLPFGSVGFYNGSHAKLVETDLFIPNGIAIHEKLLYVALSGSRKINVYSIGENNMLTFNSSIEVKTSVDNLHVDMRTGDIWFAAPAVLYRYMDYFQDPREKKSPSQVMKIKEGQVEEIYSNNGTEISGSSVAVVYRKRSMLIGTVKSDAYFCELS